jgi:hypothetical protein
MTDVTGRPGTRQHAQILEVARWPEWGIEKWEETDRAASCPETVRDEQKQMGDITQWEEIDQTEAAPPPIPAESGKDQPGNNAAKIAGGIVVGLLLLGGGFSSYQISSARALDLQPVPADPPPGISLDLAAVPMPAFDASIAPAQASPVPPPPIRTAPNGFKSRHSQVSPSDNPSEARAILPESRCDRAPVRQRGDGESQDLVRAEWAEWRLCEEQQIRRSHPRP